MAFDELYDTNVLVGVTENLFTASNWLLDRYYTRVVQFDSQYVSIDIDLGLRRMAPFSLPTTEAPQMEERRVQTNTYTPAYIKVKDALDVYRPIRRMIGERIGGDNNPAARLAANIQATLADFEDVIKRREEWMAASGLVNGGLTITPSGSPSVVLDFGRDSALTVVATGTALWDASNTTADIVHDVETFATTVLKHSGAYPTDLIVTPTVWQTMRKSPSFKDAFTLPRGTLGPGDGYRSGTSIGEFGGMGGQGGVFVGQWGQFSIYLYNEWYLDPITGIETRMIPDGTLILTSPKLEGYRAYGAIIDGDAGYRPMARFPKSWVTPDPSQRFIMVQSAPIVFPGRVNGALVATVTSANSAV